MKNCETIVPLFLLICLCFQVQAQPYTTSQLQRNLNTTENDSTRAELLLEYGFNQFEVSTDSVTKYTILGFELSNSIGFKKGIALTNRNYGVLAHYQSKIDSALFYFNRFLKLSDEIDYKAGVSRAYNNLGIIYTILGDYANSLKSYEESMTLSVQLDDSIGIARTLNNIGETFQEMGDFDRALDYFVQCAELEKELGLSNEKSESLRNIGNVLLELNQYQSAMDYFTKALAIDSSFNRVLRVTQSYRNIGYTHQLLGNDSKAIKYLMLSLDMSRKFGYQETTADILLNVGDFYFAKNEHAEALKSYNEAADMYRSFGKPLGVIKTRNKIANVNLQLKNYLTAQEIAQMNLDRTLTAGLKKETVSATKILFQAYDKLGNYEKAYAYRSMNAQYTDSLYSEFRNNVLTTYENRYRLDRIYEEYLILSDQNELNKVQLEKANLQIQKKNILLAGGAILLVLFLVLTISTYRFTKARKKSIVLLREKNSEIIQINQELEERVKKRTKKIQSQNRKLQEYAFFNSHLVRAPLANILGYTQFLKKYDNKQNWQELNQNIYVSANELDRVVRSIGEILDDDGLDN